MRALTWQGKEEVRVDSVPDPTIQEPTDAIVKVTSTAICGSDLHLYAKLGPALKKGDILGHEPMGIVEQVGSAVSQIKAGDRVVIPFNISCGHCSQCKRGFQSQCETTQNKTTRKGASLLGYTHLYGGVPGGQAEYLRVPQAQYGPIKVPQGPPDERFLFLSDVLPTSWQAVDYAEIPEGGTVAVFGLGPVGQMCARIAKTVYRAGRVIGVDTVPERLAMAQRHGVETLDFNAVKDVTNEIWERTGGVGVDSGIDAVGMEAAGSSPEGLLQTLKVQPDKLNALRNCVGSIRRGGTLSVTGVYVGHYPLFPLGDLFDKQISIRWGQANVKRWVDDILPLLTDADPLGVGDLTTHQVPLDEAPEWYKVFQEKERGCIKVVLKP